jgi:Lrp/AsnC family transcriptional regulator for asnA, asnC and gidA
VSVIPERVSSLSAFVEEYDMIDLMPDAIDALDAQIIRLFSDNPRQSVLDASRVLSVARGTVQARLDRLARSGVIAGWGPHIEPTALGYGVRAFVSLTINQRRGHAELAEAMKAIPEILELHTVSGNSDLVALVVARSNQDLQRVLDEMTSSGDVQRSSSVIVLETIFHRRTDALVEKSGARSTANREIVEG